MKSLLDKANIKYDVEGKESIITANSTSLGCVGNVLLDVQIDRGRRLIIDALVVNDLSSNCLIAWKDMQRAGIISNSFPAKAHLTCTVPKIPVDFPKNQLKCTVPISSDIRRKCTVPKSPEIGRKCDISKITKPQSNLKIDTVDSLLEEYADVFEAEKITPLHGSPMQIHLNRKDPAYRPVRVSHHRKVPLHFQEEADKTLKWFLDSGVIVPVLPTEKVEWVSPGFFVAKPNGKVRLVTDLRAINKFVERPCHPFPSPRDVIRNIKTDSKYFLKLDALQGYYQLSLDEESSYLTTFLLPSGRYRFLRAPMGMVNSSDVFCHRTDDIFAAVPDVLKIVDDALLQAPTEKELIKKLRIALSACREGNLTLSRDKVSWGKEISFAGYIIGEKGVFPDPQRTMAISNFPVPTDLTSLRGFLGLVNQLGHFLPDLAHMTVDLRQLLKKDIEFLWLQPHQEAFERIRKVLTSPLVVSLSIESRKQSYLRMLPGQKG